MSQLKCEAGGGIVCEVSVCVEFKQSLSVRSVSQPTKISVCTDLATKLIL